MTARGFIGGLTAGAAAVLIVFAAGHVLSAAAIALSDLVAPCGEVSPVHHDDRNIR